MLGIFLVTRVLNIIFCSVIIFISKKKEKEQEQQDLAMENGAFEK